MKPYKVMVSEKDFVHTEIHLTQGVKIMRLKTGRFCVYPNQNWIKLIENDKNKFVKIITNHAFIQNYVYLFSFSESLVRDFEHTIYLNIDAGISSFTLLKYAEKLIQDISYLKYDQLEAGDIIVTPPFLVSTAYDFDLNVYLGLHIDTHNNTSNRQRAKAQQVLGVNMGKNVRYFQFVNLSFYQIKQKLKYTAPVAFTKLTEAPMHKWVSTFFQYFPIYPIYRITLPPGWGYLAPTQNLIHDGSTNREGQKDIALLIRGNYSFK